MSRLKHAIVRALEECKSSPCLIEETGACDILCAAELVKRRIEEETGAEAPWAALSFVRAVRECSSRRDCNVGGVLDKNKLAGMVYELIVLGYGEESGGYDFDEYVGEEIEAVH